MNYLLSHQEILLLKIYEITELNHEDFYKNRLIEFYKDNLKTMEDTYESLGKLGAIQFKCWKKINNHYQGMIKISNEYLRFCKKLIEYLEKNNISY